MPTRDTAPPTAALADACVRLELPLHIGPTSLRPIAPHAPIAGPAMPVTHAGSVDVFLEAIDDAPDGAVLVVDNGGRDDEACVGDLITLEAREAGMLGLIVWGRHRDTAQILELGIPLHSRGPLPPGPRRTPPAGRSMRTAWLDGVEVTPDDVIAADDDGVLVIAADDWGRIADLAREIQSVELAQAGRMHAGDSLRSQLDFARYRQRQATEPDLSLRKYLAERGGAIEV